MAQKQQPKKEVMNLTHHFIDEEIKSMTDNLTEQMIDIMKLEIEKKIATSKFKKQIDDLKERNNRLARWLHDGYRDQDTAVEVLYNYPKDGVKTITRMDTNEQWEAPMPTMEQRLDNMPGAAFGEEE